VTAPPLRPVRSGLIRKAAGPADRKPAPALRPAAVLPVAPGPAVVRGEAVLVPVGVGRQGPV